MSPPRPAWTHNPWVVTSVALTSGFAAFAAVAGLIVLPYAQPDLALRGLWDAICSAAGVPHIATQGAPIPATFTTSAVVVTAGMLSDPTPVSIGRGATLALQCAICHSPSGASETSPSGGSGTSSPSGASGTSSPSGASLTTSASGAGEASIPVLAGQHAGVIYKELKDFKAGARASAVMAPFAAALTEQDMLDLAAYYAYLPRVRIPRVDEGAVTPSIVANGAPMRNIAPCASCHGRPEKAGSPWLEGQPLVYLATQLDAFASETRHNDISEQMRNIARRMTPEERGLAASHYAEQP